MVALKIHIVHWSNYQDGWIALLLNWKTSCLKLFMIKWSTLSFFKLFMILRSAFSFKIFMIQRSTFSIKIFMINISSKILHDQSKDQNFHLNISKTQNLHNHSKWKLYKYFGSTIIFPDKFILYSPLSLSFLVFPSNLQKRNVRLFMKKIRYVSNFPPALLRITLY